MGQRGRRDGLVACVLALVVTMLLVVGTGAAAAASSGVAVDLGAVTIEDRLLPGQRYTLPTIGVRNPGTETGTYEMAVLPLDGTRNPPGTWMRFRPQRFDLAPGETQPVEVVLQLAPDADPGDYETLVGARLASVEEAGTAVGAAAASRLSFVIAPASLLQGWWLAFIAAMAAAAPWSYAVPGLVLFAVLARRLSRRFSVAIERRA